MFRYYPKVSLNGGWWQQGSWVENNSPTWNWNPSAICTGTSTAVSWQVRRHVSRTYARTRTNERTRTHELTRTRARTCTRSQRTCLRTHTIARAYTHTHTSAAALCRSIEHSDASLAPKARQHMPLSRNILTTTAILLGSVRLFVCLFSFLVR